MKLGKAMMVCLWLLIPMATNALSNSGRCWVYGSWWDTQEKLGSGLLLLGKFEPVVADQRTVKTFQAYDDLVITAGIEFEASYDDKLKSKPNIVHLAIASPSTVGENIFGAVENSSEASTAFRRHWNITVSRKVAHEGKIYTFTLECSDSARSAK